MAWLILDLFSNDTGFVINPYLGYQFNPYVALEGGFISVPSASDTVSSNLIVGSVSIPVTETEKLNNQTFYAAVKGILPIGTNSQFYAKLGLAAVYSQYSYSAYNSFYNVSFESSQTGATVYGALGYGYLFTPHFGMNAEFTVTGGNFDYVNAMLALMVGIYYRF